MKARWATAWIAALLLVLPLAFDAPGALAQEQSEGEQAEPDKQDQGSGKQTKEEKERWRQEQIDAYLKRKAEKQAEKDQRKAEREKQRLAEQEQKAQERLAAERAKEEARLERQEQERQAKEAKQAQKAQAQPGAAATATEPEPAAATPTPDADKAARRAAKAAKKTAKTEEGSGEPETTAAAQPKTQQKARPYRPGQKVRTLSAMQQVIRQNAIAEDPVVAQYLDLFDRGEGNTAQYATFANFLAQNGFLNAAIVYYESALARDPTNALLWLNIGTIHQSAGDHSAAAASFERCLQIDPNNARAHYNLGVSMNELNQYDEAIHEFSLALRLDPTLADPVANPAVVNNDLLLPVQLELYKNRTGTIGLPLVEVSDDDEPEQDLE
jgi:tetratricopeptide (TPR) repeat protein